MHVYKLITVIIIIFYLEIFLNWGLCRRTAIRGNLSFTYTSVTICGRGDVDVVVGFVVVVVVIMIER